MYSSIYRVQSSTRRLPIRALFGFMLKQSSPILPSSSESPSVVVCPRFTLGRLIISTPDSTSSRQESNGNHPDHPESTVTPGFTQDTRLTTQMPVQMPPVSNPEVRPPSQEPCAGECKSSPVSAQNTYLINAYLSAMQSQYTPLQVQDDRLGGILSRNECKPWSVSYIFSTQCTLLSNVIGEPSITDPRGSTGQCTHFTSTSL